MNNADRGMALVALLVIMKIVARNSEHRVSLPGWRDFGNLTFVYDIRHSRLYGTYMFD